MKMKLICIALIALTLSACENSRGDGDTFETTPPALTEPFTEDTSYPLPKPEPEPVQAIELALFDPFYGKAQPYEEDKAVRAEMLAAAEKLADARAFLFAEPTAFYGKSKYAPNYSESENPNIYADINNPLEVNEKEEYTYCRVNPEIAETEEELFGYLRSCFTEAYISDEDLYSMLFETDEYGNIPEYKTIDGCLCMRQQYMGVMPELCFDKTAALSYDGTAAELAIYGSGPAYPPYMFFVNILKSDEYGWRLDGIEDKFYNETEAQLLYNGITLKSETLNSILGGGNTPENAETITVDGETYTQTGLDMTVGEMREFFADMFREDGLAKRYIDGVYAERDGVLYRRDGAPVWYLPELKLDAFNGMDSWGGDGSERQISIRQEFYDSVKDETFSAKIEMACGFASFYNEAEDKWDYEYYYLYVESPLPIRQIERN